MDINNALITKIVDEGGLNEVTRSGITTEFLDDDAAPILNYLIRHYSEYKSVAGRDAVLRAFPNYQFQSVQEPLSYYIDAIKESYRRSILDVKLNSIADVYLKDSKAAETLLRETLGELQITQKSFRDVDVTTSADDFWEEYLAKKNNPGADGILSGWASMDYQTLGFQPEEFAVLVGEKYMGKSWIILWLAVKAAKARERVMIATNEMSQKAIVRRLHSLLSKVRFDALRRGELNSVEEQRLKETLDGLKNKNLHILVAREGINNIEDIQTKAIEYDATVIFADSVYLFDPDATSRFSGETARRLAISQKCKRVAAELGVPFIVSVQAGRKKSKERTIDLDVIEWSNAFSQDAETVFFLHKDDVDKELKRAQIHLLKSRDGDLASFFIHQNFVDMDFSERSDDSAPSTHVFEDDEETVFDGPADT